MTLLKKRLSKSPPNSPPYHHAAKKMKSLPSYPTANADLTYAHLLIQAHRQQLLGGSCISASPIIHQPVVCSSSPPSRFRQQQQQQQQQAAAIRGSPSIVTPCEQEGGRSASLIQPSSLPSPPFERTGAPRPSKIPQNPLDLLSSVSSCLASKAAQSRDPDTLGPLLAPPKKKNRHQATPSPTTTEAQQLIQNRLAAASRHHRQRRHPSPPSSRAASPQQAENYVGERSPTTGLRHGKGIMKYPNGCKYVGSFSHNKRHGYGKVWYPSNLGIYQGYWSHNKRHGMGSMAFANGDIYEGSWVDDMPHGRGTLKMETTGEVYTGEFVQKEKCGRGCFKFVNGDVYDGEWKDDVRHGPGIMISKDGGCDRRVYYQGVLL